jgi:hypothetical protein
MRSVRILAIILALGGVVRAQQIQSTDVDLRQKNREFSFSAAEVTTPILRAYIRQNGSPYTSLTNLGGIFYFASNATDEIGMAVTNTASGRDYLEWTLTVDQTAVPGTYFAQIIVTNSTGSIQEWVRGEYEILDSPGTTALLSWSWNASNFATVAWVEAQLAGIQGDLSNAVSRTEFLNTNALVIGRIEVLDTGKVSVATWQGTNTLLKAEIAAAANLANMGGDISGKSTNATVVKIRNVAVAALSPGEEEDGYGLKYDHATQTLLLGPVATEGGSSISNILRLSGTAVVTDVSVTNIGVYRIIRPGDLPSMALNVGGYEAAYVDLLGITLKAGSIHLLSDVLAVNPAAYDGTVAVPAYSWDDDRDLGKYRMSYNGDYGEGYCVNSNLVWFWAADGIHLTNGAALFGMDYNWLINGPDLGAYAGTGTVAALDQRLTTVESWPTDTWSMAAVNAADATGRIAVVEGGTSSWNTAYGWGNHAMEGYLTDEADPLALHTSSTYTAWTDAGGTYTQEGVFASSALLTNGYAGISYSAAGMSVVVESSTDSNTWGTAVATNTAVYLRLSANNDIPPFGEPSLTISNIIVTSWSHPATWRQTSDTAGQIVLVDNPTASRQIVNKQTLASAVAAVTPSSWAQYPATTNVNLSGHRLIMTEGWTLTQTGGVGIISYADAWATSNELTIAHNGVAVISAQSGVGGLHIDDFSIVGSNVTLWVSTNGVVSAPLPQYTADLLAPDWATIGSYTSTYPVVTNSAYRIDFDLPDGNTGFFRAIQQVSAGLVNISADLQVQGAYPWRPQTHTNDAPGEFTPRWIGDELIIHDSTNIVYRAFGSTTNDWVSVWP